MYTDLIQRLEHFQAWRRGSDEIEMPAPAEIGKMIDEAIDAISALDALLVFDDVKEKLKAIDSLGKTIK